MKTRQIGRGVATALLVMGLALIASAADAFGPHGKRGRHGPPIGAMIEHHAEQLGLDDETREAIHEIVERSHEEGEALRDEVEEAADGLRELLEADDVDREAVLDQVERVGDLRTEAKKHRIETLLEIRSLLTPEQREAMKEMRRSFRGRHFGPLLDACEAERADCPRRGPRMLRCLHAQGDSVSPECAEALDALPSPHRGWFGPGPGER